ncbi:neuropilin-2-like [Actinia tenebrosa]|uniref:Neuropilin-2-like n=1 Tax=Actinia tenebrosa TaxID=6105 RepID=A0A6P8HEA3_ACTTE|nr:neuropilin-2-like [Actinia tenebrosa]
MNLQISNGFYHFRVLLVMITFNQIKPGSFTDNNCADRLIGVENRYIIPDSSFTATSQYYNTHYPYHARLNSDLRGWAAKTNSDPNDYLQIDFGLPYVICAVATQGSSAGDEWVTQYKISLSMDNIKWKPYQENGALKFFAGNTDRRTIKKHFLSQPLTRCIRFIPTTYQSWKTMRVGVYGYLKACENSPLGMESGAIQYGNITASSDVHLVKNARLHYTSGSSWCASTSDSDPYLQIDLGTSHLICAVATQGNSIADQWVKTYQIDTWNSATWTTYQENNIDRVMYH